MSDPVTCRFNYPEMEKILQIQKAYGLKSRSEAIQLIVKEHENEDKASRRLSKLVERLEKKIGDLENQLIRSSIPSESKITSSENQTTSSENDELTRIILKIVLRLAESNPRACAALKDELPELFEK